ncbi:hypothetical protein BU17DRAFT_99854 [Hysterangium stoloniferum]|nr:hypothetical protein BU17DRAFT_99854 [Hysterangium stoloniferum]
MTVFESAMALRIWALYQRSRKVSILLVVLIIGTTVHGIVVDGISLRAVWTSSPEPSDESYLTGCNDKTPRLPALYGSIFYLTLVLEVSSILLHDSMANHSLWTTFASNTIDGSYCPQRHNIFFFALSVGNPGSSTTRHLPRFLQSPFCLRSSVVFFQAPIWLLEIQTVLSMNCSRLILSIRDAFHDVHPSMPTTESNIRITTIQMRSRLGSAFGELTQLDAADLEQVICEPPNNGWLDRRKKLTCSEDTRLELGELETVPEAEEYEDSGNCSRS